MNANVFILFFTSFLNFLYNGIMILIPLLQAISAYYVNQALIDSKELLVNLTYYSTNACRSGDKTP